MRCVVCGGDTDIFGCQTVLRRHRAVYRRCTRCGLLRVEQPTWLAEAYASAVADVDIGTISRMVVNAKLTKLVLHLLLTPTGKYLDYGAGYGAFVRRMRDLGYDFRWFDQHCDNLFAKGFAGDLDTHYDVVTAFEVFEHLEDPVATIEKLASVADHIVFSTSLVGQQPPPLGEWPYYAPETGQHIVFYTAESLGVLAGRLGLHFHSDGQDFHLLTRSRLSPAWFRAVTRRSVGRWIEPFLSRPTLLYRDFQRGREAALQQPS